MTMILTMTRILSAWFYENVRVVRVLNVSGLRIQRSYPKQNQPMISNISRMVSKAFSSSKHYAIFEGRTELDTHADTFVAGRNCIAMNFTERVCDVMPYSSEYEARKGIPIAQVATRYTNIHGH